MRTRVAHVALDEETTLQLQEASRVLTERGYAGLAAPLVKLAAVWEDTPDPVPFGEISAAAVARELRLCASVARDGERRDAATLAGRLNDLAESLDRLHAGTERREQALCEARSDDAFYARLTAWADEVNDDDTWEDTPEGKAFRHVRAAVLAVEDVSGALASDPTCRWCGFAPAHRAELCPQVASVSYRQGGEVSGVTLIRGAVASRPVMPTPPDQMLPPWPMATGAS